MNFKKFAGFVFLFNVCCSAVFATSTNKNFNFEDGYPIIWTDTVGVVIEENNTITSTVAGVNANSWLNTSGAASINRLPAGQDGWIEFEVATPNGNYYFGFSEENEDANGTSVDYGVYDRNLGFLVIYEFENWKGNYPNTKVGDIVRLERIGSTLYYKVNGEVIKESPITTNSLIADIAIGYKDKTLKNPRASFPAIFQPSNNCTAPSSIEVEPNTRRSFIINWEGTEAQSYTLRARTKGTSDWVKYIHTKQTKTYMYVPTDGLYEYQVKGHCGEESSQYSAIQTFSVVPIED